MEGRLHCLLTYLLYLLTTYSWEIASGTDAGEYPRWARLRRRRASSPMGVPAFFKWLSTKYGKIIVDCLEERHTWSDARVRVRVRVRG